MSGGQPGKVTRSPGDYLRTPINHLRYLDAISLLHDDSAVVLSL